MLTYEEVVAWRLAWDSGVPVESPERLRELGARIVTLPEELRKFMGEPIAPLHLKMESPEGPRHDLAVDRVQAMGSPQQQRGDVCPDCSNLSLIRQEGCKKCLLCGYSEC